MINVNNPPHDSPYSLEIELLNAYLQDIISLTHKIVLKTI